MGMFDSLYVKCPHCNKLIEFQSKSGSCGLWEFNLRNLPSHVARGMNGQIIKCDKCGKNIKFTCKLPNTNFPKRITKTKDKAHY